MLSSFYESNFSTTHFNFTALLIRCQEEKCWPPAFFFWFLTGLISLAHSIISTMLNKSRGHSDIFFEWTDGLPHKILSARVTVEAFFHTFSTQMCGKRTFTRATGESEYPRQDSHLLVHYFYSVVNGGHHWASLGKGSKKQTKSFCNNYLCPNHTANACIHFVSTRD